MTGFMSALVRNKASVPFTPAQGRGFDITGAASNRVAELGAMEDVSTLFSIIDLISTAVAERQWKLYRTDGEERVEVDVHPALTVWNKPNDFYTQDELIEAIQQHYELTGEMWCLLEHKKLGRLSMPTNLWPLRPDRMTPVKHPTDFISGYLYSMGGEKIPLDIDQVLFERRMNPKDAWRGLSPISSLAVDIAGEKAASRYNTLFFANGAEPGGIIELNAENTMDDADFDRFKRHWQSNHKGYGNAHRVAILEMGKYSERSTSHKDMEFVGLRTFSRESMMEAYRVSPAMLGHVEDVNRANNLAQAEAFDTKIIIPRLNRLKRMLNTKFLPRFGALGQNYEFDYDTETNDDPEALASALNAVTVLVGLGFDPEAAALAYGLPELPLKETIPTIPTTIPTPQVEVEVEDPELEELEEVAA